MWCCRCAHPKADSFPAHSVHACGSGIQVATPSTATTSAAATGAQGQPPTATAKTLRAKLDGLVAARSSCAQVAGCEEQVKRLEADIAATRGQLAANLPVEVAVKATIGPTGQARAAVQRSEAKVAKLEAQIVALMASHQSATAELADHREKLAEAEAATARAAAPALPQGDLAAALAANPAAVWTALLESIQVRVPGMPQTVIQQLNATTNALQQACALLPAQPVVAQSGNSAASAPEDAGDGPSPPAAAGNSDSLLQQHLQAAQLQVQQQQKQLEAQQAALAQAQAQRSRGVNPSAPSPEDVQRATQMAEAAAAATAAAAERQLRQQQHEQTAAAAAAEAAQLQQRQAAAAAALAGGVGVREATATAVPAERDDGAGTADDRDDHFVDASDAKPPADDSMGGGADEQIARKRALEAAQQVVARAKAKV
jgi:hypothetical protein